MERAWAASAASQALRSSAFSSQNETIARIAKECPNCGVSLSTPGALDDVGEKIKAYAGPVVMALGVLGAVAFGMTMLNEDDGPRRRPVKVSDLSGDDGGPDEDDLLVD